MSGADEAYFLLYVGEAIKFAIWTLSLFFGNRRQSFKLL